MKETIHVSCVRLNADSIVGAPVKPSDEVDFEDIVRFSNDTIENV